MGRFTEEQIIAALKEREAGAKTSDSALEHSEAAIYKWKS
ncbi:transposase [Bradyrhizobium sp. CCBAU 11434]